jgi:glycosyltransferase involved in cell wall biosynthesis
VVHFTSNHPWVALFLPLLADRRFFLTLHDAKPHVGEANFIRRLNWFMFKRYAAHFFVHGEAIKAGLCEEGVPASKMTVVPHGDYAFFTRFAKPGITETPTVLFFGRILPYKGLPYLLEAAPAIARAVPRARIVIAGEGDFTVYADAARACPNVQVLNQFIREEQVAELFQQCRVVVLPYVEASQTGIIPIAYSFRKPVVATRVGSIPEVVEDGITGYLVPPRDSAKLAEAVVRLLQDSPQRHEMGENAHRKMRDMLGWDKICDTTIKTYEHVLGSETPA